MRKEVQQNAGPDRTRPAGRCHEVERQGRRAPFRQDRDETPGLDGLPRDKVRLERYPLAGLQRGAQGFRVVGVEPGVDVDRLFGTSRILEPPGLPAHQIAVAKASMVLEIT